MFSSRLSRKPILASVFFGEKSAGIRVPRTGLSSSLSRSVTANALAVAARSPATIRVGANFYTAHRS
jgi:hypothetical protein